MNRVGKKFSRLVFLAGILLALFGGGSAAAQPYNENLFNGMKWRLIGPFRGGRVLAVAGVPGDPNVYYFGGVAGGVWKSTDGGSTWQPLFDKQPISSIGSIAVAESDPNVIYVGTGEACIRGNISYGDGVYKSVDGGRTWKNIGLRESQHIGRVMIHPKNSDIVFVAALGHAYGPNVDRGIFRSLDGGKTWEKVLYKDAKTGGIDIAFDPSNPNILFAALWETGRTPWSLTSGGPGSGLYRSADGGATWKHLEGNGLPKGVLGRIGVSVSAVDGNRVYALIEAEEGGLYRSEDGGEHWRRVNDDHRFRQRAWYYTHVFADPGSADGVYVLNTGMYHSTNGGQEFTQLVAPHGDHHGLWIDSKNPQRLINGNDGGATVSVDGGKTWTRQDTQPTAQFYHVITDNRFPYYVYGAQQDNSTVAIASRADGAIGRADWYPVGGGESGYIAPDPRDPNIVYAGSYMGLITRFDKRTGQAQMIAPWPEITDGSGAANLKHRFQWTTPILISPHDPNVLYQSAEVLFKSTNGGMTWRPISGDLTRNDKSKQQLSGGPITKEDTGVEYFDVIFAVAESSVQKDLIWAGTDDGWIHLTRDAGAHWTNVTPREMPEWSLVSLIDASPHEAGAAYVAVDRHKFDDFHPYVYKTSDFGKTWTKITSGLPDTGYVHAVREDPKKRGQLYAGTELGVHVSFDDGAHWQPLQLNLPAAPIHDLVVKDGDLVVATHGRSFWILDDLTPLRQLNALVGAADVHLYTPRLTYRTRFGRIMLRGRPFGENPPDGAIISYYLKTAPKEKEEITLEILDAQGKRIRKFSNRVAPPSGPPSEFPEDERPPEGLLPAEAGMNRFAWNLRYENAARIPGYSTGEYDEGLLGPFVVSGQYKVRLTADGKTLDVPLEVKLDPRVPTSQADLEKQLDLRLRMRDRLTGISNTVNQIRDLRNQLRATRRRIAPQNSPAESPLLIAVDQLVKKITAVEEELIEVKLKSGQDSLNYGLKVDGKLAALASTVEAADTAPNEPCYEFFDVLNKRVEAQLTRWQEITGKDVPALNDLMRKENVPLVSVTPVAGEPRGGTHQ